MPAAQQAGAATAQIRKKATLIRLQYGGGQNRRKCFTGRSGQIFLHHG
ncbi:Hypothetical protein GbCGDNIH9_8610 [Granulibacter bethesdensis]|uniref:Uncharacterized protein n=1 Tax=Granulibacter bethesdensis TaxID=364410 RepID=A0AAC9P8W0_9PROT|nr:Hypothetical protein GbCGDNIH9_8610 [Granulibacter bethesdensis]APH62504.1 Hypothetical protein GbCGDNIH8_8610 [Granulibacter bethesdensis]